STGTTRRSSSSAGTPRAPGRVDSPPTSTIAAPSESIRRAAVTAATGSRCAPPSENESGVTLITPITDGRLNRSSIGGRAGTPPFWRRTKLRAFGLGRLHGRARQREGPRLRQLPALRLQLLLLLGGLRVQLGEHGRLVLAREQALELILVDRLALDEDLRDPVQVVHVLAQHAQSELVPVLDDPAHLVVDLAGELLGVVRLVAHVAAEERQIAVPAEHAWAELLAHPVAH